MVLSSSELRPNLRNSTRQYLHHIPWLHPFASTNQLAHHAVPLQNIFDTRRTGGNETMLGAAQEAVLARETNAAARAGPNQTVWQQYLGGLVMLVCS